MKAKICYTIIYGPYDSLKEPKIITPEWKYICFTDQSFTSDVWEIRPIPEDLMNKFERKPVKRQRILKIQPHLYLEDYEVCIYVDGTITINVDLNQAIEDMKKECGDFEICIPVHPMRRCIYREGRIVTIIKKDVEDIVKP